MLRLHPSNAAAAALTTVPCLPSVSPRTPLPTATLQPYVQDPALPTALTMVFLNSSCSTSAPYLCPLAPQLWYPYTPLLPLCSPCTMPLRP